MAAGLTVGVPRELKADEYRTAVTPDGVKDLTARGIEVVVEHGAGVGSDIADSDYVAAGAAIAATAAEVWERAAVICKVKELQPSEFDHLRPGLVVFTFLHLAAYPVVAQALLASGCTAIAYETVEGPGGELPLLTPMSEIAGMMSVQIAAHHLERHQGGRGVLLGGAPGVRPARVVVLGAGSVGWSAARLAAGLDAEVQVFDTNLDRLRWVDGLRRGRLTTLASNRGAVERAVAEADVVIGAVLVAGGKAPIVVDRQMLASMKPGALLVDVAIDQGGCIETSHETTHESPTFVVDGVVHYAVGNIPGAVPNTSTRALTNATLPFLGLVASAGPVEAARQVPGLAKGINVAAGAVTNSAVATALGLEYTELAEVAA